MSKYLSQEIFGNQTMSTMQCSRCNNSRKVLADDTVPAPIYADLSISEVPVRGYSVRCPQQRVAPARHRGQTLACRGQIRVNCDVLKIFEPYREICEHTGTASSAGSIHLPGLQMKWLQSKVYFYTFKDFHQ